MDMRVLYADTLFLSNFVLNLLALSLSGRVMHLPTKKWRLYLASALGGAYAVLAVLLALPSVLHIFTGILLSGIFLLIAFGKSGRIGLFLRTLALFYFSNVLLGGAIEALFALLEESFGARLQAPFRTADAVLVIGFLAYLLLRFVSSLLGGGALPHSVSVRIEHDGRAVTLPLLVDSGCLLSDPMTGKGVILVSVSALRSILPREVLSSAERPSVTMPHERTLALRCRLIPMQGAGGEKLLLAFRPDQVCLLSDGRPLDVFVALYTADSTRFGGCRGLLSSGLLYGRGGTKKQKTFIGTKKGG